MQSSPFPPGRLGHGRPTWRSPVPVVDEWAGPFVFRRFLGDPYRRDNGDVEHLSFDVIDGMDLVAWTLTSPDSGPPGFSARLIGRPAARRSVEASLTWILRASALRPAGRGATHGTGAGAVFALISAVRAHLTSWSRPLR